MANKVTQDEYSDLTNLGSSKKIYKPITAIIRIIDPITEKIEATHIKNIDDKERREWVLSTVMWAMMSGKIAEVVNKDDDKDE